MRTKGDQVGEHGGLTLPKAQHNNSTALQRVLDDNGEELLWVAEVMAGSKLAGEQCLAEAIELAEAAQYVADKWMLSWIKRLLAHVALRRISADIRELLPTAGRRTAVTLARAGGNSGDWQRLRSIPPQRIIASLDVLERACLILHAYLQYSVLDCALLLGCPQVWIESTCARVLTTFAEFGQPTQDRSLEVDLFNSPGVTECAG